MTRTEKIAATAVTILMVAIVATLTVVNLTRAIGPAFPCILAAAAAATIIGRIAALTLKDNPTTDQ